MPLSRSPGNLTVGDPAMADIIDKKAGNVEKDAALGLNVGEGDKRYVTSRVPSMGASTDLVLGNQPAHTMTMRSLLNAPYHYDQARLDSLQKRLVDAGLLAKAGARGVYDEDTRDAWKKAITESDLAGKTPNEWLADYKGKGPDSTGSQRLPNTLPAFQPVPEKLLEAEIRNALGESTGKRNPDVVKKLVGAYRAAEKKQYEGSVAADKQEYKGGGTQGTIEQLPDPSAFVHANVDDGKEAGMWRAAQAISSLHDKMRTGSL